MVQGKTPLTLSCIGAGRAGKTLCRLFAEQQCRFEISIGQIINRSRASAQEAVTFIGQGQPGEGFENLSPANIWLIASPDDAISAVSERLSESGVLRKGDIVFHCSGSLSSDNLSTATDIAYRASVHPIHSFADPQNSLHNFSTTACAIEGDQQASAILTELFTAIGGHCFALDADKKALYHAATVMASNNLVSLLSLSQQLLEAAGIETQGGENILQSLAENSLNNYFNTDGIAALTGPISRGDSKTIKAHIESLKEYPDGLKVYASLGEIAVGLSAQQGYANSEQLVTISRFLNAVKKNKN
ncbi:MAG: DUF2520 domain-containing protein [Porticoccaceae bacterium]|nr:DUF2520 domain-containing protein [Porticoccaceae bacterium]